MTTILLFLLPVALLFLVSYYMKLSNRHTNTNIIEPTDLTTLKELLTQIHPKDFTFSKLAKENDKYVFYSSIKLNNGTNFSIHFYLDKEHSIEEVDFFYRGTSSETKHISIDLKKTPEETNFLQELWNSFDQTFKKRKEKVIHWKLKEYDYFSFNKEDSNFNFYCSNRSNTSSLRFIFNQHRQLREISIHSSIRGSRDSLLLITVENMPSELEYFQEIWDSFKKGFKQDKNTRVRMITEGFI